MKERVATVKKSRVTATEIGNNAEDTAAQWLHARGFRVIERNWKTKFCEIDIIALKNDVRYFIEVKHRASNEYGGGVSAITSKKVQQMRFAAELYAARYNTVANDQLLVIISSPAGVVELLELE